MSVKNPEAERPQEPLRDDPGMRAAYSANPGFMEGAEEPHPIDSSKKSILARPEIAEALEAVHTIGLEGRDHGSNGINLDLARTGIRWLRENISNPDSVLRRKVIEAKSGLDSIEQLQKQRNEADERRKEEARKREAEERAAAEAEEASRIEAAKKEAEQATFRADLDENLERILKDNPELDTEGFLMLCDELEISDGTELAGTEKPGFQPAIDRRVSEYLKDPKKLVNDVELIVRLGQGELQVDIEEPPHRRYRGIIFAAIKSTIARSYYSAGNFPSEVVGTWLEIAAAGNQEEASPVIAQGEAEPKRKSNPSTIVEVFGEKILGNTLDEIIKNHPDKYLDAVYMIAEQGLYPDSEKLKPALTILQRSLGGEMAKSIIYAASVSKNARVQRRAVDFRQAMIAADPEKNTYLLDRARIEESGEVFTREDLKNLYQIYEKYLKLGGRTLTSEQTIELDKRQDLNIKNFLEWVSTTDEGVSTTLYGRFL